MDPATNGHDANGSGGHGAGAVQVGPAFVVGSKFKIHYPDYRATQAGLPLSALYAGPSDEQWRKAVVRNSACHAIATGMSEGAEGIILDPSLSSPPLFSYRHNIGTVRCPCGMTFIMIMPGAYVCSRCQRPYAATFRRLIVGAPLTTQD